ncbi:MAG TPA: ABC transporter substrate-binding protein [Actinopolymorphaceae bacterium]
MATRTGEASRRDFLKTSAAAAALAMLAGCASGPSEDGRRRGESGEKGRRGVGSSTRPLPTPSRFREAPMLAKQVEAGELPPVEERLPDQPYVVPHNWLEPGKYGGELRMMTPKVTDGQVREYMYGHSLLRWLNDGLDIGPGLAVSWESNEDASEWTLHLRKGVRWSDGEPWTARDILFWWEDLVLNEDHPAVPPDEMRSGTGTLAQMSAPDDYTLVLHFDAPAPLTADRLAMWVKGGNGDVGPIWTLPRHYVEQFHPKYNPEAPKDWASKDGIFFQKADFVRNPECPTLTGWRVTSVRDGEALEWERNPYYWCVDPDGNQLPFIDRITMSVVQDFEVAKLQMQEGRYDYVHGPFAQVTLADISGLKQTRDRSGLEVVLWDNGDGTGNACFFFNYDYRDPKMRALIREPKFRQALSLGFNREEIRKAVHFGLGEPTTGTMSPKAIEFHVEPEGPKIYKQWRDAYNAYDPERAKQLLDEIGVVDRDGDGKRELPDGSKLTIVLTYAATAPDVVTQPNTIMVRDWQSLGLDVRLDPIPPESMDPGWQSGSIMARGDWGVGDGPNCLVYPQWLVPIEPTRWAPLQGQFYNLRGTPEARKEQDVDPYERTPPRMEPEPGGPIERLWEIYDRSKVEPDEMKRHQLVWEMTKIHIEEGPFFQGSVANTPAVIAVHRDLGNVPRKENLAQGGFAAPWIHPTPAVYDPEAYFWRNRQEHGADA